MLLDAQLTIADGIAVPLTVATHYSSTDFGNNVNLGDPAHGVEGEFWYECRVREAFTSGGSATVTFTALSDTVDPIDGSSTAEEATSAIAVATLVAGYKIFSFPLNPITRNKIWGLKLAIATAALTAGKIDCYLTRRPELRD